MDPVTPAPFATPASAPGTSTLAKADIGKRLGAAAIDGVIVVAVTLVLGSGGMLLSGIGTLAGAAYILLRDGLSFPFADGRSVGKHVIGLRPVRLDGGAMTPEVSARRNAPLALASLVVGLGSLLWGLGMGWIGAGVMSLGTLAGLVNIVEGILVLTDGRGRRLGDRLAETQVVADA